MRRERSPKLYSMEAFSRLEFLETTGDLKKDSIVLEIYVDEEYFADLDSFQDFVEIFVWNKNIILSFKELKHIIDQLFAFWARELKHYPSQAASEKDPKKDDTNRLQCIWQGGQATLSIAGKAIAEVSRKKQSIVFLANKERTEIHLTQIDLKEILKVVS